MSEPTTEWNPARNSERCHALAIKALREINIRAGNITPSTPEEQRWASEGPREVSKLECVRG